MIDRFQGEYRFLSNFHGGVIKLGGELYPSAEHAYQAAKTLDPIERLHIRSDYNPGTAKRAGRSLTLRPDWDAIKDDVMLAILRQKFSNPVLRERLLATGSEELVEGNDWGDRYWGVCQGEGLNKLGRTLMQVRHEIQEGVLL